MNDVRERLPEFRATVYKTRNFAYKRSALVLEQKSSFFIRKQ